MNTYNIDKQNRKELYSVIDKIINRYHEQGVEIKDLKKYFKKEKNLRDLIKDIKWLNRQIFASDIEYTNYIRTLLQEVISDFIAEEKDKPKKQNEKMMTFQDYLKENGSKTKTFNEFVLNEIALPVMKIDEILQGVSPIQNNTTEKVIAAHFGTYIEYIDIVDKKRHHFKVNDMKGDILNSTRVTFDVVAFHTNEIKQIRNNIINFAVSEFYLNMPEFLDVFGIKLKPTTFINKDELKSTFDGSIPEEQAIEIISNLLGFKYECVKNEYYIWSKK